MVLLFAGLAILLCAVVLGDPNFLPKGVKPSGFVLFDIFNTLKSIATKQSAGIGFLIMTAGGFAAYMDRIGAAKALVDIAVKPLSMLRAPYLVLVGGYFVGQILVMVIPSAAGLAMLLLVALFPKQSITEAMLFILVLKTGCAGLSFSYLLTKKRDMGIIPRVMFSTMYALSSYVVVLQHNVMWMDNVIVFPLLLLAVDELISKGKFKLYVIALRDVELLPRIHDLPVHFHMVLCEILHALPRREKSQKYKTALS